jgi:uncharacterized membrane protein YbaN (DUF454 family)
VGGSDTVSESRVRAAGIVGRVNAPPPGALDELRLDTSRPVRVLYATLGFLFLAVGIAGQVIPGLPGTLNLIVALFFFSRSSERMYRWMLTNRFFGRSLRDYKNGLGIPRRVKVVAVVSICLAVGLSVGFFLDNVWVRLGLVALGAYGIWFVLTRPTTEVELARRAAEAVG